MKYLKYLFSKKSENINWFIVIRCRMRSHPCGVIWYNTNGLEPDYTCKICGDDLG